MGKEFIVPIELQSIDSSTLSAANYTAIGNPIEGALTIIRITNASDEDVIISYDGVNEHGYIVSGGRFKDEFQSNARHDCGEWVLAKGTVIYAKGTAGIGYIYVAGYYNG